MRPFRKAVYYENIRCRLELDNNELLEKNLNTTTVATSITNNATNLFEKITKNFFKKIYQGKY